MERQLLDMKCAECGAGIAKAAKDEALLRKCLGILQEDGLYAFFLYLAAEKKDQVKQKAFAFMKDDSVLGEILRDENDPLAAIRQKMSNKLDDILLVKELMERVLVYALYHTRAAAEAES